MKVPGPDHPITIKLNPKRVQVTFSGHLIVDTRGALALKEADYPTVFYIPREDVETAVLGRTAHTTHCPYKGDAAYYTLSRDGQVLENAVWSYEDPYPAVEQIRGYLAFYPDKVAINEIDESADRAAVAEAIEHTDSGAGASQREHWPAGNQADSH
jgi:uncharacterized protein (DUF427 family)